MILCFLPPFLEAFIKIHKAKLFGKPGKVALVNIHKVLNTQDEERHYFSNFDPDTKLMVLDYLANVNIWNCHKDFVNFKPFTEDDMSEHIKIVGDGASPYWL